MTHRHPLLYGLALAALVGCEANNSAGTGKMADGPRETIGKTTQDVLKLEDELNNGAVLASTSIAATDPLTQAAAGYRTSVGKLSVMAVQQAIQIRNAQSIMDPKPLTYDELMAEIIKPDQPDGIKLPQLPYYQSYAWDEANQSLVVIEYPQKKTDYEQSK